MARTRQLYVALTMRAENYNNALRQAQRETREFQAMIRPTMKTVESLGQTMRTVGIGLTAALTAPIAAVAGLGIQFNAMQEQAQIAFTTLLKDAEKARSFLGELKDFAARTPFEFPGLVRGSQRLLAMGFAAEQVKPLLTTVGDAAAGLGGTVEVIDRITLALGQMQGRGRVATQEMNQLTEVGIPAWRMLAEGMGISEQKLRDMVEKGLVPAERSLKILEKAMNETFGGMMQKQAEAFSGTLSTIKDEARFIAGDLTTGLFNVVKGPLKQAAEMLSSIRSTLSGMSDESKALFAVLAGGLAAIGPGLLVTSLTLTAISSTINSIAAIRGAVFAAIEVLAGAGTIRSLAEARIAMGLYAQSIWAVHGAAIAATAAVLAYIALAYQIIQLGNALADYVESTNELEKANKELEQRTRQLEAALRAQGVTVNQGTKSLEDYNTELQKIGKARFENPAWELIKSQVAAVGADLEAREKRRKELAQERAEAAERERKETEKLIEQFQKALRPADDLNKQLDILVKHFGKDAVVKVWGDRIHDAATEQQKFGNAVKGATSELDAQYLRLQSIEALRAGYSEMARDTNAALGQIGVGIKPHVPKVEPVVIDDIEFLSSMALQAGYAAIKTENLNAAIERFAQRTSVPVPPALSAGTRKVQDAMGDAQKQAVELGNSINELYGLEYTAAQITAVLGGDLETAARNAEIFNVALNENTVELLRQMDATRRAQEEAKRWEQTWTQVFANIVTDFARGMTDVIFQAKSFAGAIADVGKTAGRAFTEAFFAELFNPLTQQLAAWGRELAKTLQSSVFPKIAGALGMGSLIPKAAGAAGTVAAGAGGAATVGGAGSGLGASLGAFFSNPLTIGAGVITGGVLLAKSLIGRGRESADRFGDQIERPFMGDLSLLLRQFQSQRDAGTLTLATATAFRDDIAQLTRQYTAASAEFAAQSDSNKKVAAQAEAGKTANFGKDFERIFTELNAAIAPLQKAAGGVGIAETGRSFSASNIFAEAVDVFKRAADKMAEAPRGTPELHFTEGDIHVTVEGENKSSQQITEEVLEVLRANRRGTLEELIRLLESGGESIATA